MYIGLPACPFREFFKTQMIAIVNLIFYTDHGGTKVILLFFQKTRTLQSRGVVTLFHLFTIAIYGRNCFDMQH